MALTFDRSNGQVADTEASILGTDSNTRLLLTLNFHNTDTVDHTLEIWLYQSATGRKLHKQTMAAGSTLTITDKHVLAATSDQVAASADTADVIDYWISFVEIS